MPDGDLTRLGIAEMARLRLASPEDNLDGVVVRMQKAYPGYYGSYAQIDEGRAYLDGIPNLFLVIFLDLFSLSLILGRHWTN